MSDSMQGIRRKIDSAQDLGSVVRTMKAMAAANITQFEKAVLSLGDYYRAAEWGLHACLDRKRFAGKKGETNITSGAGTQRPGRPGQTGIVVFGSDQGLVGQFNQAIAASLDRFLAGGAIRPCVWAVGERLLPHLERSAVPVARIFPVPGTVAAITPLVARLIAEIDALQERNLLEEVYVFFNRPVHRAQFEPVSMRILPLGRLAIPDPPWPGARNPQIWDEGISTTKALIGEYLFVSVFTSCAESLASENGSRLTAMERAEKNIGELTEALRLQYHRLRQDNIDAELFDILAGSAISN